MKNYSFTSIPIKKKKILIVDDEVSVLKLLQFILKDEYDPIIRQSGIEALSILNSGELPDLIISDMEMPFFSGVDFIKSLKTSGYFRNIPVIVLSGSDSSENIQARIPYSINGIMLKPFNPTYLKDVIKSVLN
ncbi:MAG: response regulator [Daejeonella sp.]